MTKNTAFAPLQIEIIRGPAVESRHQVHAVLMDGHGKTKAVHGVATRPTFPRSAIKALQAIALVESGAAAAYKVSDKELALACASHSGEDQHTSAVKAWLERLGLSEQDLECGAQATREKPLSPAPLCNNCSGKHTGMLTLALFLETQTRGYTELQHKAQQKIMTTMSEMTGTTLTTAAQCGIDGCSAPAPVLPLQNLALAFARFMNPEGLNVDRALACRRLFKAAVDNPAMVQGTGGLDTVLMEAAESRIFSKGGAEGIYIAAIPAQDTVLVLKAEDGAQRAAQAALYGLLEKYQLADKTVLDKIRPIALPAIKNWRGIETGSTRVLVAT